MTDRLTGDRFQALADAYGGVIARWPSEYRQAAEQLARRPEAAAILMAALALDETLDGWRVPAPAADLAQRVIAAAPAPRRRWRAGIGLWWSGIGVATTLAGAAAGVAAVAMVTPVDVSPAASTSFGDITGQDS